MKSIVTRKYLIPFALVASLFFCWGFAHSILDVLNKHFQNMLEISKTRSALVQAMVYGGYFIMAIPAGVIIRKWGYKAGDPTFSLFFLPPYSPQLNIAETLWRILKGKWIRPQDYITSDMLFYTTNRALADIGKGLRINFSKHVA